MDPNTLAGPLQVTLSLVEGAGDFRVEAPEEVHRLLQRLTDGNELINLNAAGGLAYATTLWSLDRGHGVLALAVDLNDPRVARLAEADDLVAVCYVDNVKLQFELHDVVLVHGHGATVLRAALPRAVWRFQRRASFRVQPLSRSAPRAVLHLTDPSQPPGAELSLRLLDVSQGGCALFLPEGAPRLQAGLVVARASLDLDASTQFETGLRLHHVTAVAGDTPGARLGCSMTTLTQDAQRALQRYIDQTQKRRRMFSLR
jgi:flagellar brake protein